MYGSIEYYSDCIVRPVNTDQEFKTIRFFAKAYSESEARATIWNRLANYDYENIGFIRKV